MSTKQHRRCRKHEQNFIQYFNARQDGDIRRNKVNIDGYGSVSEYIRELIRRDYHLEVERKDTSFERYRGNPEPPQNERSTSASRPPLASASKRYSGYRGR